MRDKNETIVVTDNVLPIWQKCVAIICFLASVFFLFKMVTTTNTRENIVTIYFLLVLLNLNFALIFIKTVTIKFEVSTMRYKYQHTFSFIKLGIWRKLPEQIEYISIFNQPYFIEEDEGTTSSAYRYNVNVWYEGTKHFTIYTNRS